MWWEKRRCTLFSIPVERRFSCCTCSGGRRTGWPSALDKREMRGCEKLFFFFLIYWVRWLVRGKGRKREMWREQTRGEWVRGLIVWHFPGWSSCLHHQGERRQGAEDERRFWGGGPQKLYTKSSGSTRLMKWGPLHWIDHSELSRPIADDPYQRTARASSAFTPPLQCDLLHNLL